MSAFRDLLKQAHEKGVQTLAFRVNLDAFFADEQNDSWTAAGGDPQQPTRTFGRTGEEALRHFVEKLP